MMEARREMEKRRRVILYGKSVIMGSVGASLRDAPGLETVVLDTPLATTQGLAELSPDVIIFDLEAAHPDAALSLLRERPGLLLIGVDPASDELLVLSSQQKRAVAVADLLRVIQRAALNPEGDEKTRECSRSGAECFSDMHQEG